MLFHIAFLGKLVQLSEHAAVMHVVAVDYHTAVCKIAAASVVNVDAPRRQILLFVGLKQILLIVPAAEHRIADICSFNKNPPYNIIVLCCQLFKVHIRYRIEPFLLRRYSCIVSDRLIICPVDFSIVLNYGNYIEKCKKKHSNADCNSDDA